jgi:hypothetical protein
VVTEVCGSTKPSTPRRLDAHAARWSVSPEDGLAGRARACSGG